MTTGRRGISFRPVLFRGGEKETMVKLKIFDKEYGLRLDMYALEQIEEEFGGMKDMFAKLQSGSSRAVQKLFKILANAQLAYEGREETVTGDEIRRLRVSALNGISDAIKAAVDEGMKSEMNEGEEADDDVYDVYLSEIESKN